MRRVRCELPVGAADLITPDGAWNGISIGGHGGGGGGGRGTPGED